MHATMQMNYLIRESGHTDYVRFLTWLVQTKPEVKVSSEEVKVAFQQLADQFNNLISRIKEKKITTGASSPIFSTEERRVLYSKLSALSKDIFMSSFRSKNQSELEQKKELYQTILQGIHPNEEAQKKLWKGLSDLYSFDANKRKEAPLRIKQAIDAGADVNLCNERQKLPLHECNSNFEAFTTVLEAGADPLITDGHGNNAFFYMDEIPYFEALFTKVTLSSQDVLALRNAKNQTPLAEVAKRVFNKEVIAYLINKGADLHVRLFADGKTILHVFAESSTLLKNMETCILLGADVNAKPLYISPIHADTPLSDACMHNNWPGALLLIQQGATIDRTTLSNVRTIIDRAEPLPPLLEESDKLAKALLEEKHTDAAAFHAKARPILENLLKELMQIESKK